MYEQRGSPSNYAYLEPKDTTHHVTITIGTADKAPLSLLTFSQPLLTEVPSAIIDHFGIHCFDAPGEHLLPYYSCGTLYIGKTTKILHLFRPFSHFSTCQQVSISLLTLDLTVVTAYSGLCLSCLLPISLRYISGKPLAKNFLRLLNITQMMNSHCHHQ